MQKKLIAIFLFLLVPALGCTGSSPSGTSPAGGKITGGYTATLGGDYSGKGSATVTTNSVSLVVSVANKDGSFFSVTFGSLQLDGNHFRGTATANGTTFTISGRVDLPAVTDSQLTPDQMITGRIVALLSDASGKAGRIVAIQDVSSRGGIAQN